MYQVIKRDGHVAEFSLNRISSAIMKAFDATHIPYAPDVIDLLSLQVTADYADKIRDGRIDVETIQDSVETVLQRAGYAEVAEPPFSTARTGKSCGDMSSTILDYKKLVDDYLRVSDWRVKENSTVTYSVGGLILSNSGAITANYWLSEIYDEEIGSAHRNADLHIHDLSMLTELRRLEPEAAHSGRVGGCDGEDHQPPGQAPGYFMQPDGEFPGHYAERVGGCAGIFQL